MVIFADAAGAPVPLALIPRTVPRPSRGLSRATALAHGGVEYRIALVGSSVAVAACPRRGLNFAVTLIVSAQLVADLRVMPPDAGLPRSLPDVEFTVFASGASSPKIADELAGAIVGGVRAQSGGDRSAAPAGRDVCGHDWRIAQSSKRRTSRNRLPPAQTAFIKKIRRLCRRGLHPAKPGDSPDRNSVAEHVGISDAFHAYSDRRKPAPATPRTPRRRFLPRTASFLRRLVAPAIWLSNPPAGTLDDDVVRRRTRLRGNIANRSSARCGQRDSAFLRGAMRCRQDNLHRLDGV